ncbi:MAG: HAMP domain-containing sensor histidine kinase [Clostridium sp.]
MINIIKTFFNNTFKNKGITLKLFIITSGLLIFLISISLLIQSLFFETFYYKQKEKNLIKSVDVFKDLYYSDIKDNNDFFTYAYNFEEEHNAKIALLNKNGVKKYIRSNNSNGDDGRDVIDLAIANWLQYQPNYFEVLINHKTTSFDFINPISKSNNLVIASPIIINSNVEDIIFVVSTLQPLDEAAYVAKRFYLYVSLGIIFITSLLALIYAKMISKPLINITSTATKMANLDFSTQCEVTSYDEIGNLSISLNFLSYKLNSTLSELKSANSKLTEDIEKERNLEKMRKDFVAGVSHELKTPISLIQGYAEGIKDGIVDAEDMHYYLDVILDESDKMNKLVIDMLDLSALESGNFHLKPTVFNLHNLIEMVYKKYIINIHNRTITYSYAKVSINLLTNGDTLRIEEVITNLLDNAINYSPANSTINISLTVEENKLKISIENEGPPIPEEELTLIWDKFYRLDKSRNKNSGGTGLGLSIVKNILDLHKSNYVIENSPMGVKVAFTLDIYTTK